MNEKSICKVADTVKKTQEGRNNVTDLVYNQETGEFEVARKGENYGAGEIVTDMTKDGFAA